jgi:FMN hydrolase / 5-amino-6-(5-phospho-D-ribitylamino)uracil phosphatase
LQHIRAITLDLDDTLWEIGPVISRAEAELWCWLSENCPRIPALFSEQAALQLREEVIAEFQDKSHDLRFLRKAVLGRMVTDAGYPSDLVEDAFSIFDAARNRVELYPDVVPALTALAEQFRIIAVTNGNANLEKIGIRHLFEDVVTAVDAGAAKPQPAIFEEAVKRAGVSPFEALHVGDHPEYDVAGAKSAGLATVWMNRRGDRWPEHLSEPDAIVSTVIELHQLVVPAAVT